MNVSTSKRATAYINNASHLFLNAHNGATSNQQAKDQASAGLLQLLLNLDCIYKTEKKKLIEDFGFVSKSEFAKSVFMTPQGFGRYYALGEFNHVPTVQYGKRIFLYCPNK